MSRDHREVCRCGHHKDSHFEKKHTCLGMQCECKRYRDPNLPDDIDTLRPPPFNPNPGKPHADSSCPCLDCYEWMQDYWYRSKYP